MDVLRGIAVMKKSRRHLKKHLHDLQALQELHSTWDSMVGWPKEEFHDGIRCLEEILNWHGRNIRRHSKPNKETFDLTAMLLAIFEKNDRPSTIQVSKHLVDKSLMHNLSSGF